MKMAARCGQGIAEMVVELYIYGVTKNTGGGGLRNDTGGGVLRNDIGKCHRNVTAEKVIV